MDTSDIGPGGSDYFGNCTPDGVVRTVTVEVTDSSGTTTTTFDDTGQVLNPGGFDLGECPGDSEAILTPQPHPPGRRAHVREVHPGCAPDSGPALRRCGQGARVLPVHADPRSAELPRADKRPAGGQAINLGLEHIDPNSPTFQAAQRVCQRIVPGSN